MLTWREEVKLADGRRIVIEREEHYQDATSLGGPATVLKEATIVRAIEPPAVFPVWKQPLVLKVIDYNRVTNEWIIVGYADTCESWNWVGMPQSDHVEYRLRGGQWVRVDLDRRWAGQAANVLVRTGLAQEFAPGSVLSDARKRELNDDPNLAPEYRWIKPIPSDELSCYVVSQR